MTPTEQLALWADRLRDISAMGLLFTESFYDRERYRAVQTIAMEMLALASGQSLDQIEPLRGPIFSSPTPFSGGDAAVIDDQGQILLIRRADNGRWAMPGGALEVGETPAEGAMREALEETGVCCRAVSLVGVFDSRLCGTVSRHHLYQFLFLCRPMSREPSAPPSHAAEVREVAWFPEDGLPEDLDPGHRTRIPEAFRVWHGDNRAFFDAEAI
jgi:ADP-ribose pyrophosphatase YjhB (NUDIX family)